MPVKNITLYCDSQFLSPYVMSVFVTLKEKGIPFKIRKINLKTGENNRPGYADISLTQRVPAITHGDFHLSESSAISEYLDEMYPPPDYPAVYPADIDLKARARQIQAWIRSDFLPVREERPTECVFCKPSGRPLSEAARADIERLFAAADRLVKDDTPNLFGAWCIADTDLALMLNRLVLNGDDVPGKLKRYALHQWEKPSVQLWVKRKRSL